MVESLRGNRLNREDLALLERGYYEELLGVERTNVELWNLYEKKPADWRNLWQTEAVSFADDLLRLELRPEISLEYKGERLSTNRWGMRDRDYEREKPPGTSRIAVLGSSPVMGSGVADDETFEWRLEERLNREARAVGLSAIELLSFAVDGYTLIQQLRVIESKALRFEPDAILYIAHETEADKTITELARILERRIALPYPELLRIAERAGVRPGTPRSIARRRLYPVAGEIVDRAYRHLVALCRSRDVEPIWAFVPMPATAMYGPAAAADARDPRVAALLRSARGAGFRVLDLSGVYDGEHLPDLWVADWDRHPNARAHELIADRLYELLTRRTLLEGVGSAAKLLQVCADC